MAKGYDLYPGSGAADELIYASAMAPIAQIPQQMYQNILASRRVALMEEEARRLEIQRRFDREQADKLDLIRAFGGGGGGGAVSGGGARAGGAPAVSGVPEVYRNPLTGEREFPGAGGRSAAVGLGDITTDMFVPQDMIEQQHGEVQDLKSLYETLGAAREAQGRYMASERADEAEPTVPVERTAEPPTAKAAADKQVRELVPGKKKRPKVPVAATRVEYGPEYIESRKRMQELFPETRPKAGEETVSDMVQALPVDDRMIPTEELPSFMPQDDAIDAEAWTTTERAGTYYDPDTGRDMTPDDVVKELIAGGVPEKSAKRMVKPRTTYLPAVREHGVRVTREDLPEDPFQEKFPSGGGPQGSLRNSVNFLASRNVSAAMGVPYLQKDAVNMLARAQVYENGLRERGMARAAEDARIAREVAAEQQVRDREDFVDLTSGHLQTTYRWSASKAEEMAGLLYDDEKAASKILGHTASQVLAWINQTPALRNISDRRDASHTITEETVKAGTTEAVKTFDSEAGMISGALGENAKVLFAKYKKQSKEVADQRTDLFLSTINAGYEYTRYQLNNAASARGNLPGIDPADMRILGDSLRELDTARQEWVDAASESQTAAEEFGDLSNGEDTTDNIYTPTLVDIDGSTWSGEEFPSFASGERQDPTVAGTSVSAGQSVEDLYAGVEDARNKGAMDGAYILAGGRPPTDPVERPGPFVALSDAEIESVVDLQIELGWVSEEGREWSIIGLFGKTPEQQAKAQAEARRAQGRRKSSSSWSREDFGEQRRVLEERREALKKGKEAANALEEAKAAYPDRPIVSNQSEYDALPLGTAFLEIQKDGTYEPATKKLKKP